ncbi:type IV pilin N-terminal domain-containing protein [Methanogenium organophilum]|uniref:Type IV pilin N-terminal domain-containing protein n=1 Tax=Methanogenium organophilum TaxID=2199 RepID=A0A9X9S592_METOG|nr:type IV pilin N-terminal domain-containing protein [Methanogenium organophilum]WAI01160.1 type IV pilin N-terminal domain-containing protein [Methanogenium organophilum]
MRFHENEEAVSPVIGVILMVAITVILAAVIAVFVFGMTDNVETTKTVAVTAKVSDDDVLITFQGGPDAAKVSTLNATVYDAAGALANGTDSYGNMSTPIVGDTSIIKGVATADGQERVLVTATFNDGTKQVILDKFV